MRALSTKLVFRQKSSGQLCYSTCRTMNARLLAFDLQRTVISIAHMTSLSGCDKYSRETSEAARMRSVARPVSARSGSQRKLKAGAGAGSHVEIKRTVFPES